MLLLDLNIKQDFNVFGFPTAMNYHFLIFRYWIPYDYNFVTKRVRLKVKYQRKRFRGKMRQSYQVLNINSSGDSIFRTAFSIYDGYKNYRKIEPFFVIRKFLRVLVTYRRFFVEYVKYYSNIVDRFFLLRSFTFRTRFNFSFFKVHHYFFCCTSYLRLVRRFNLYFFHRKFYIMRFILRTLSFKRIYNNYYKKPQVESLFFSLNDIRSYKQKRYLVYNDLVPYISNSFYIYMNGLQTFFSLGFFNFYFFLYGTSFIQRFQLETVSSSFELISFKYSRFFIKYCLFFLIKHRLFFVPQFKRKLNLSFIYYLLLEFKYIRFLFGVFFFNFALSLTISCIYFYLYKKILFYYNYLVNCLFLLKSFNVFYLTSRRFFTQFTSRLGGYSVYNLHTVLSQCYDIVSSLSFLCFSSVKFTFHNIKLHDQFFFSFYKLFYWSPRVRRYRIMLFKRKFLRRLRKRSSYKKYKLYYRFSKRLKNLGWFNIKKNFSFSFGKKYKNLSVKSILNKVLKNNNLSKSNVSQKRHFVRFFGRLKRYLFSFASNAINYNFFLLRTINAKLLRFVGLYLAFLLGKIFYFSNIDGNIGLNNVFFFKNNFLLKTRFFYRFVFFYFPLYNHSARLNYKRYLLRYLFNMRFVLFFIKKYKKLFLRFLQDDLIFLFITQLSINLHGFIAYVFKRLFFSIVFFDLPLLYLKYSTIYYINTLFSPTFKFFSSFFSLLFSYFKFLVYDSIVYKLILYKYKLRVFFIRYNFINKYKLFYYFIKNYYNISLFFNSTFIFFYRRYFINFSNCFVKASRKPVRRKRRSFFYLKRFIFKFRFKFYKKRKFKKKAYTYRYTPRFYLWFLFKRRYYVNDIVLPIMVRNSGISRGYIPLLRSVKRKYSFFSLFRYRNFYYTYFLCRRALYSKFYKKKSFRRKLKSKYVLFKKAFTYKMLYFFFNKLRRKLRIKLLRSRKRRVI